MIEGDMLQIKVPASTANLGPGFDSLGLALQLYLTIDVEKSEHWEVVPLSKEMEQFPRDEQHLICQVAIKTAAYYDVSLAPCKIMLRSDIPLARGLGSSAAAIVAGIELANKYADLQLTKADKLRLANEYEGHPDNVSAAIYGGLVVNSNHDGEIHSITTNEVDFSAVVVIPNEELLTTASREVLPEELTFEEAVTAGTIANVLVAALFKGDFNLAGKMMASDRYHQPYRAKLVPLFAKVEKIALKEGAFGVALSGAGPTVICFCTEQYSTQLQSKLQSSFASCSVIKLDIDLNGSETTILSPHR